MKKTGSKEIPIIMGLMFISFFVLWTNVSAFASIPEKGNLMRTVDVIDQNQQKEITGKVVDKQGNAIIGATIRLKGSQTIGTVTNTEGNFHLSNVPSNGVLVISYTGFKTKEISIEDKNVINILLEEDSALLDEVVVVAYGTQKARSITGAMSKINTDEIADMPVANITQKMQGKFAGVQILNNSGEPNGNLSIRIRGQASINAGNNPLIVVDGFPTSSGLESISPDEIESISILKDAASTTLYGSRAANGVILITTKQGKNSDALPYINQVRTRAGLPLLTNCTLQDVSNEMRHELAFENHRWSDLKRMGLAKEVMIAHGEMIKELYPWVKAINNNGCFKIDDFRMIYAIPIRELEINNLLTQNPGY